MISDVPTEIKLCILEFLPWNSLLHIRCVNRYWSNIIDSHGTLYTTGEPMGGTADATAKERSERLFKSFNKAARKVFHPNEIDNGAEDENKNKDETEKENFFRRITPIKKGVKVHGIIERLCIAEPEDDAMMEVPGVELHRRLARWEKEQERDEGEWWTTGVDSDEDEEVETEEMKREKEEEGNEYRIPFASSSLFHPPVWGPVPCRVMGFESPYHRFLIHHHQQSQDTDEDLGYLTVLDACRTVNRHLRTLLQWECRYSWKFVNKITPCVNEYGWLDLHFEFLNCKYRPLAPKRVRRTDSFEARWGDGTSYISSDAGSDPYGSVEEEDFENYSGHWNPQNKDVKRDDFVEEPEYVNAEWFEEDESMRGFKAYYGEEAEPEFLTDDATRGDLRDGYFRGMMEEMYKAHYSELAGEGLS